MAALIEKDKVESLAQQNQQLKTAGTRQVLHCTVKYGPCKILLSSLYQTVTMGLRIKDMLKLSSSPQEGPTFLVLGYVIQTQVF